MKKEWNVLNKNPSSFVPKIVEDILKNRGVKDIQHFLSPQASDLISLNKLSKIDEATQIIIEGIKQNKRFMVFPDAADLDGISSGTIMMRYLSHFTDKINYVFAPGKKHGLNSFNKDKLDEIISNTDILIIVDSSSADKKEQVYLRKHDVQVIIYDHHNEIGDKDTIIVNSQYNSYPNGQLSGAGVTWKGCLAIDQAMNTKYAFNYVDLAAIGILADVMNVDEDYMENRLIIKAGLANLQNMAIQVILGDYEFNSTSVLYSIAPLINSAARMNQNELAIKFFLEDDKKQCKKYLKQLKDLKNKQKQLVKENINDLEFQIKSQDYINNKFVYGFVDKRELTGLIGSQMCEEYDKPAIIFHTPKDIDNIFTGSIRAIGIDNFKSIINNTGLAKCQGHESAAGIFVKRDNFEKLKQTINKSLSNINFKMVRTIDIELRPEDISIDLIKQIQLIDRITGNGFKPIHVAIRNVEIKNLITMQKKHLKFSVGDIDVVYWNSFDKLQDFKSGDGIYKTCDIEGTLSLNKFRGQLTKQIVLEDYCNVEEHLEFLRDGQ